MAGLRYYNFDPLPGRVAMVEQLTEVAGSIELGPCGASRKGALFWCS